MGRLSIPLELELETYSYSEADLAREVDLGSSVQSASCRRAGGSAIWSSSSRARTAAGSASSTCTCSSRSSSTGSGEDRAGAGVRLFAGPAEAHPGAAVRGAPVRVLPKYPNEKRFGLDGEFIPGMLALADRSAELGVEAIVVGMRTAASSACSPTCCRSPSSPSSKSSPGRMPTTRARATSVPPRHVLRLPGPAARRAHRSSPTRATWRRWTRWSRARPAPAAEERGAQLGADDRF